MNILIRCDSSNIIGTGHVMRCLNLCEYYPENNYTFICRNFLKNINSKITEKKYNLIDLKYNIEPVINNYKTWLGVTEDKEIDDIIKIIIKNKYDEIIIDHYGIDHNIEKVISKYINKILVITDILDYKHYCDIYINYNYDCEEKLKKINLKKNTIIKCGISNIIINKKFLNIKKTSFRDKIEKICIMMGGSDPNNFTLQVLQKLLDLYVIKKIKIYIIIGKSNIFYKNILTYRSNNDNIHIYYDISYDELINLYLDIDLCIGSLSITAYERLYMKIPQICIKIVENQNIISTPNIDTCKINDIEKYILKYF
jgi:UDP-2,4-diacetamido-2,4,6-trideoxy-beta-L-altropyranose hydrolase